MNRFLLLLLPILALPLTACAAVARPVPSAVDPASSPIRSSSLKAGDLSRVDQQGAVVVEVTPRNLDPSAGDLQFDVFMNTHSVDLSMDLASLSTLTTDTGVNLQATLWEAPRGGHHVSGRLVFPAAKDGGSVLDRASKLTLTIRNVDAPIRVFEWDLR